MLTFNEKLSGTTLAGIQITKDGSSLAKATVAPEVLSADGKTVTLTLKGDTGNTLTVADYKVVLGATGAEVKDAEGNPIYAGTEVSFRPTQAELEQVKTPEAVSASYDNSRGKLTVTYDAVGTVTDVTKLSVNGVALTAADTAVLAGNVLTVTLGETSKAAVNALTEALTLTVAKDAVKVGEVGSAEHTVAVEAITPAKLLTASYNEESNILTLEFDQKVKSPDLSKINFGTADGTATALTGATDKEATVTEKAVWNYELNAAGVTAIETTYTDKAAIKVILAENAVTNVSDATVKSAAVAYENGIAVTYVKDETKPTLQTASFSSVETDIKFKFNEALQTKVGDIIIDTAETATANRVTISANNLLQDATDKSLYTIAAGAEKIKLTALYNSGKEIKVWFAKDVFTDTNNLKNDALTFATGLAFEYADFDRPELSQVYNSNTDKYKVIDNTHLEVKFNEVVTKETAENVSNYVIEGPSAQLQVVSAQLQADNQTVLITTAASVNNVDYNVSISGVKDKAGNTMNKDTFTYKGISTVVDTKVEVASVTVTAPKSAKDDTIAVTFTVDANAGLSASATQVANYRVLEATTNDEAGWDAAKEISLTGAEITVAGKIATIKLASNLTDGKFYKVIASNITDTLGNAIDTDPTKNTKVSAALSATATALTAIAQSNTKEVVLSFDGALNPTEAAKTTNYTVAGASIQSAVYSYDETKGTSKVTLTLTEALKASAATTVNLKNLASKAVTGTPTPVFTDTVAPKVKSAEAKIVAGKVNDELVITFDSNDVSKAAFVAGIGSITLKDSKGNSHVLKNDSDLATVAFTDESDADKVDSVKFTFDKTGEKALNLQANETYTVDVADFVDASGNELLATTVNVAFTADSDKVGPKAQGLAITSGTQYTLTFDEVVNTKTSAVRGNYVLEYSAAGDFKDTVTLQPTFLTTTDNTVVFNFATAPTLNGGKVRVKFVNIEDLAGNKQAEEQTAEVAVAPSAPADTTPPKITASNETVAIANLATWTETVSATDDTDGTITNNVVATYFEADGTTSLDNLAAAKAYIDDATTNKSFVIKYNVSDAAGNAATEVVVTITVNP